VLKPEQIASLAPYEQVLLQAQKKVLVTAALKELEAISTLHFMFNGCHTRFGVIIVNNFDASVLLLAICTSPGFTEDDESSHCLGINCGQITKKRFLSAV
jgi:hypothetical protein